MMDYVNDIISTRKHRKFTYVSPQNLKDHDDTLNRIKLNGVKMDLVSAIIERQFGRHVTIETLLMIAQNLSKEQGIKIDRLAKRNRSALLCWYAENWTHIYPHLNDLELTTKKKHDQSKDQQNPIPNDKNVDPSDIFQLLNYH